MVLWCRLPSLCSYDCCLVLADGTQLLPQAMGQKYAQEEMRPRERLLPVR